MESLHDRVVAASPRAVVVTAPAGYGKSTFVRAYARTFALAAVCDCDGLRDAGELARRVVDALAKNTPEIALEVARSRLARGSEGQAQLELLNEYWPRQAEPMLFAFENADGLRRVAAAHEVLEKLAASAPAQRTIVFCSRVPLPAAFGRAIGSARTLFIAAEELQLGEDDVVALAGRHGVGAAAAREIARLSSGWPMVVQLLIAVAASGRFEQVLARLDDVAFDELYDYLADEVIGRLEQSLADAVVVAAAVPDATLKDIRSVAGERFDAVAERRLGALPFVRRDDGGAYELHPLVRAMVRTRFAGCVAAAHALALEAHERRGDAARAAQIALASDDVRRAARVLDRLPTYVRAPAALPECEQVVARLEPAQLVRFPSLWIATMPFRRFSVDLATYLHEARTVYYCLPSDADAALRTDALLHLAAALYQSARFDETETAVGEALDSFAREPSAERATLLTFVATLRGLQGRFSEARALRAEADAIRRPDFLSDLGLHYVDAHEAIARGRYERGIAIIDESLRRMQEAKLPLYVAFTATNGAIFAWANGDDERFARYVTQAEEAMIPGIERGFASLLAAARGRAFVPDPRFESPVALAMAHLYRMGYAQTTEEAAGAAAAAVREADRCADPYLQTLAHAASLLLGSEDRAREAAALVAAARRVEAPELRFAAEAIAAGRRQYGVLEAFVARRVLLRRAAAPRAVAVHVFAGRVEVDGRDVRLAGKELELLLYLALGRVRVAAARAQIAEAIWPDIDDENDAANNLRVTLSRLRRKLGDDGLILRGEDGYRLSPAVAVDVREVETLVRAGGSEPLLSDERRAALQRVFDQVAHGLPGRLERFAWFAPHRLRLRELALAAGTLLAGDALARRVPAEALRCARTLVELDPLDEDARRLVLDAYAALGEWSAARRELEAFAELLREELDAEPSPDLADFVEAARERHCAGPPVPIGGRTAAGEPGRARRR
ncbi:MAG: winged helix-turn-helix domain-containing protein [Candidatus Eremiobacteraeota bacterium]|nr:winged helix-turn-helix domain-containing protein [Candidatus Eremiobacteraeota bacterium]